MTLQFDNSWRVGLQMTWPKRKRRERAETFRPRGATPPPSGDSFDSNEALNWRPCQNNVMQANYTLVGYVISSSVVISGSKDAAHPTDAGRMQGHTEQDQHQLRPSNYGRVKNGLKTHVFTGAFSDGSGFCFCCCCVLLWQSEISVCKTNSVYCYFQHIGLARCVFWIAKLN